jgi:outer membrane protein OmpA-like peptidoglycan-associated protein
VLAADRARAVAAALAGAGVRAAGRITIVNAPGTGRRGVILTQSFVGDPR